MLGLEILEVAIGIIFIFVLVSVLCTAVREGIETVLKTRSAYLEHGIRELLHDRDAKDLAKHVYQHPLIYGLFSGGYQPPAPSGKPLGLFARGGDLPSYIPSRNFALALMDIAARGPVASAATSGSDAAEISPESIRANIRNIVNPAVQRVLLTALDEAQGDLDRARKSVELWFDSGMDRVSGHYKRSSQKIIFWIGLVIAVLLNIDAIRIADYLYRNDAARAAIIARAEVAVGDTAFLNRTFQQTRVDLDSLRLPIGWSRLNFAPRGRARPVSWQDSAEYSGLWVWNLLQYGFLSLLGWVLVAAAATLGAPFWFDVLNKVMVIRSTVKPFEKSPPEASEDRQLKPAATADGNAAQQPAAAHGARATAGAGAEAGETVAEMEDDEGLDGCGIVGDHGTADEELPPAEGGVA